MNNDDGLDMIACDTCNEWFHLTCINVSAKTLKVYQSVMLNGYVKNVLYFLKFLVKMISDNHIIATYNQ